MDKISSSYRGTFSIDLTTALTKSKISNAGNRTKFKPFSLVVNQPVKPQNLASRTGGVSRKPVVEIESDNSDVDYF